MLTATIAINGRVLDEIHVQNLGFLFPNTTDDTCRYMIKEPEGFEDILITHKRKLGYEALLKKVLTILGRRKRLDLPTRLANQIRSEHEKGK